MDDRAPLSFQATGTGQQIHYIEGLDACHPVSDLYHCSGSGVEAAQQRQIDMIGTTRICR